MNDRQLGVRVVIIISISRYNLENKKTPFPKEEKVFLVFDDSIS
jgi:hypothetical protein